MIRAAEEVTGKQCAVKEGPRRPGDPPALVAAAEKVAARTRLAAALHRLRRSSRRRGTGTAGTRKAMTTDRRPGPQGGLGPQRKSRANPVPGFAPKVPGREAQGKRAQRRRPGSRSPVPGTLKACGRAGVVRPQRP